MNDSNSPKLEELKEVLEEIKETGKLLGIIFAERDGSLIFENVGIDFNGKQFSSMCASVLESASGLCETIGNRNIKKIITELVEKTIIIIECNNETFLTLVITRDSKVHHILDHLQEYTARLTTLYHSK